VVAAAFGAVLLASCAGFPGFGGETGLACQNPPRQVPKAEALDPYGPGSPFADRDATTMTPAEAAAVALEAGLDVTFRLSYRIGQPDPNGGSAGYSECWCVPPPAGNVVDLGFDSGGRLIIFVDSGETLAQARQQPRMGWGCADPLVAPGATWRKTPEDRVL
jgi:hypothetical protein